MKLNVTELVVELESLVEGIGFECELNEVEEILHNCVGAVCDARRNQIK